MGKTNKIFHQNYDEDEDYSGRKMHSEKKTRHHERLVNQALKTKNVSKLVELEEDDGEDDYIPEFMQKDYKVCNSCGITFKNDDLVEGRFFEGIFICEVCSSDDEIWGDE